MHVVFSETINTREEFHWLLTLLVGVVAGLPHLTISKFACKRNGLKTTFSTCCHFAGFFQIQLATVRQFLEKCGNHC